MKKILTGLLLLTTLNVAFAADKATLDAALAANNVALKSSQLQLIAKEPHSAVVSIALSNNADDPITVIAANSMTAKQAELCKAMVRNGETRTRKINKIVLQPQDDAATVPFNIHVKLSGLKQMLHKGDAVPVLLIFADGSSLLTQAKVEE